MRRLDDIMLRVRVFLSISTSYNQAYKQASKSKGSQYYNTACKHSGMCKIPIYLTHSAQNSITI